MITYLYWMLVFAAVIAALVLIGGGLKRWGVAVIVALLVLLVGWAAYYFHFQQVFVKRWGGIMHITVPDGQFHIHATWKEDNLWIENFDPAKNECIFTEYSKGNLLEGRVIIRNCSPLQGSISAP
jgi:hypothetical protein